MKILIVHTYYQVKGGEDSVYETESRFLASSNANVNSLKFNNTRFAALKFLLYPFNPFSFIKMLLKLKAFKPDIVHVHNWHYGASASIFYACKLLKVPVVCTLHNYRLICPTGDLFYKNDVYLKSLNSSGWLEVLKDKVYRNSYFMTLWVKMVTALFSKTAISNYINRYLVLSENAKNTFINSPQFKNKSERFIVKSNFIEDCICDKSKKNPYVMFVGRLTIEKGIHVLLTAFKKLNIEIRIIGDGALRKEVEEAAALYPNIKYLGYMDHKSIKEQFSNCKALVFPSICLEGMPMTILEAFACHTPVICSKFSAMETMITDRYNGLHFERGNADDLQRKVTEFFNLNDEDVKSYFKNARKTYEEKYTPEINIEKLVTIYKDVLYENAKPYKHAHFTRRLPGFYQ